MVWLLLFLLSQYWCRSGRDSNSKKCPTVFYYFSNLTSSIMKNKIRKSKKPNTPEVDSNPHLLQGFPPSIQTELRQARRSIYSRELWLVVDQRKGESSPTYLPYGIEKTRPRSLRSTFINHIASVSDQSLTMDWDLKW